MDHKKKALFEACKSGNIGEAKKHCNFANVNQVDDKLGSPLHVAIANGHKDIVKLLLDKDANPSLEDRREQTALHIVCKTGNLEIFQKIIEKVIEQNEEIDIEDGEKFTPFHRAVENNHIIIADKLLKHHTADYKENLYEQSPLHTACLKGHYEMAKLILENTDDCSIVNKPDNRGQIPLHCAAELNHYYLAKLLLECGSNVNHLDDLDQRPLMIAVEKENDQLVKLFIKYKVWVREGSKYDYTPLHYACHYNNLKVIKLLLKNKAPIEIMDKEEGRIPLTLAAKYDKVENISSPRTHKSPEYDDNSDEEMEVDDDFEVDPVVITATNEMVQDEENPKTIEGHKIALKKVQLLKKYGAKINKKNGDGYNALHIAAANNNYDLAKYLLENNINVNSVVTGSGLTALHYAVHRNSCKMVSLLLDHGANINCQDDKGNTPLHYYQNCNILRFLFSNGADINISNYQQKPPIKESCNKHSCMAICHLRSMETLDLTINDDTYDHFNSLLDFDTEPYEEEIEQFKKVIINYQTLTTMYDLFFENIHTWVKYVKNEILKKLYEENNSFCKTFPYYGHLLDWKYIRATRRYNLINASKAAIDNLASFSLPNLCSDDIFKHLSEEVMRKILATQTNNGLDVPDDSSEVGSYKSDYEDSDVSSESSVEID